MHPPHLHLAPEVAAALQQQQAVVALESTIIAHGMPYPQNIETAQKLQQSIRQQGAVPATIAIIGGQLKAGLTESELQYIAQKNKAIPKVSRRDLAWLVAEGQDGATTVAATMIIAQMAGIKVFATGGIGGVHRGGEDSMDVSADLQELAKTNVAVVCAGAKAILDLERTMEYLETQGVPVVGYRTKELPAFYTRKSGILVNYEAQSPAQVARFLQAKWQLGLQGGAVIANPIPPEYEMDANIINQAIEDALAQAKQKGIKGKDCTPFLLECIENLTKGSSLTSNIALASHNATLAADIAVALAKA